ncbi:MAG: hypothetical protein FD153_795 [Rhodospirillaceae bacterium]|nr:MAG: hypothetical protein FD153_795 [Rhodospirillaceae bacterium]
MVLTNVSTIEVPSKAVPLAAHRDQDAILSQHGLSVD